MNGWFIAYLIIAAMGLGSELSKHGEEKRSKYNFWTSLISVSIAIFIVYKAIVTGF